MAYYYATGEPILYGNEYYQVPGPYVTETIAPLTTVETTTTTVATAPAVVETVAAAPAPIIYQHSYVPHLPVVDGPLPPETLAEIESRVQSVHAATTRSPMVKRETIPVAGPPGRVRNVIRRLPTPEPDLIERTTLIKPAKDVVNVTIEKPITPAPIITHKQVVEDPGLPTVNHQVVAVQPRPRVVSPVTVRVASPIRVGSPVAAISPLPASYQHFF